MVLLFRPIAAQLIAVVTVIVVTLRLAASVLVMI